MGSLLGGVLRGIFFMVFFCAAVYAFAQWGPIAGAILLMIALATIHR